MMAGSRITRQITIILTFFLSVWLRCPSTPSEPEFDNPLIPGDPTYEPPQTTITSGPVEGAVVDTHTVSFTWRGNQTIMTFSYRLNESGWSAWSADTMVTYTYQDEGDYLFEVKGRYLSWIEEDTAAFRNYTVDDIHGPALWLQPRYQEVDLGGTFTVEVMLEEMENVFAVKAVLEFDTAKLQVENIEVYDDARSLLKANGGTVIPFSKYDNTIGTATIDVATATGDPPGVSGTGAIALIAFTAVQSGQTEITFDTASAIRDPDNQDISLYETVAALVEVR
ncbi:MAG: cohesin domain-containing protein [Candidatus Neomarinimicrobiota bacterium]